MIIKIVKKKNDLISVTNKIALIHKKSFDKNHFTSTFSIKKLVEYNMLLIQYSDLFLIATNEEEGIVGYIISGTSVAKGVKKFIDQNKIYISFLMIKNPNFLFQKLYAKIFSYFFSSKNNKTKFRLFSISVDPTFQSKGVGGKMLDYFELQLKKLKVKSYGLSVRNKNAKAIKFYSRNKFIKERNFLGYTYFFKKLIT